MSYSPKIPAKVKKAMKEDALALAELVYDMYKEEEQRKNDIVKNGQNNAQSTKTN
jgi:hypothetical protein